MSKYFHLLLICFLVLSCKNNTKDTINQKVTKENSSTVYQCPMNCEKGKSYTKKGKCPVCNMHLKHSDHNADCSCTTHNGDCTCDDKKCTCSSCTKHSKKTKKEVTCTCKDNKECKCEKGKCSCEKCPEHS